jgi:hypothetical protein
MHRIFPVVCLGFALASAGCIRSTTAIDLHPDGSGTIVQETGVSAQAQAMLKGMGGNQTGGGPTELFSEEQARKAAAAMGVTFVSGEPIKTADLEGYRARFSFDDISKVKVSMEQGAAAVGGAESKQPPFSFSFNRGPSSSILTIDMPEQMPSSKALSGLPGAGGTTDADKAQAAQALAMMKMMMRGLFVDVALNVDGRILKSNANHVDGSRVTLLQIDFDKLLADDTALQRLQAATDAKSLEGIPGLKIVSEPKLTIEFAR